MFDAYSRRARLAPAAVAAVPAIVLLVGGLVSPRELISVAAISLGVLGVVICGVVRGLGQRLQPGLWESWGGAPAQQRLRWRNAADPSAVERRHRLFEAVTDEKLPSRDEELADPAASDRRYDEAVATLRELTRKRDEHPLVADENAEYGFRRNCLGLRPIAMGVAAGVVVVSLPLLATGAGRGAADVGRFWVAAAVGGLWLVGWWKLATPSWVRSAAERYADRLMAALEVLIHQRRSG